MGFNEDTVARQPAGTSSGGQFTFADASRPSHGQVALTLDQRQERARMLAQEGYVPPVAAPSPISAKAISEREREMWWGEAHARAEYNNPNGEYPQMPDDYTPGETSGRALSHKRHTHRMRYTGNGIDIRMPSATSIKRFADENQGTFDIPVTTEVNGTIEQGWVRATRGANGQWSTEALGFKNDIHTSEGVRAVLESRKPSMALRHIPDLKERYHARQAMEGASAEERKSFIKSVGYDPHSQTQFVSMGDTNKDGTERTYAYEGVDPATARTFAAASSTGRAYNKLIKGAHESSPATNCPTCGRFYSKANPHVCPTPATPRVEHVFQNEVYQERAQKVLGAQRPTVPSSKVQTDPDNPDIKDWARSVWKHARKNGQLDRSNSSVYGPGVRRGFTMNPSVISAIEPFTDRSHVPGAYRDPGKRTVGYSNGDTGLMNFDGLDSEAAQKLLDNLPKENLQDGADHAPSNETVLKAVAASKGRMEAHGFIVPPSRNDERVSVNGVVVYADTDDPNRAKWEAVRMGLQQKGMEPPAVCRQVETPWNDKKAWVLSW